MSFLEQAKARYSVRKFSDRKVERDKIDRIIEAANLAPTATNAQAFHIWVICSEDGIAKVNQATKNGYGAKTILVLGADRANAWAREDDKKNFADIDAGIVACHIMFEISDLGLGTVYVGRVNPKKLVSLFQEMEGYDIVGIFPIGYPSEEAGGKPAKKHTIRKQRDEISTVL